MRQTLQRNILVTVEKIFLLLATGISPLWHLQRTASRVNEAERLARRTLSPRVLLQSREGSKYCPLLSVCDETSTLSPTESAISVSERLYFASRRLRRGGAGFLPRIFGKFFGSQTQLRFRFHARQLRARVLRAPTRFCLIKGRFTLDCEFAVRCE